MHYRSARERAWDLFLYLAEVLGYERIAEHFFYWLDSDTVISALADLADEEGLEDEE